MCCTLQFFWTESPIGKAGQNGLLSRVRGLEDYAPQDGGWA